ncbi:hypothetical protein [Pinisolibacter sp.]|uniref:hypothetical protein n=1 Tax=Pinisolibacter sp. TaxID=2172024 RepID=UPI002FDD49AD
MFFFFHPSIGKQNEREWEAATAVLDFVRTAMPSVNLAELRVFLEIIREDGSDQERLPTLKDFSERLSIPYPTLARHTDNLGSGVSRKGGLGLIDKIPTPTSLKEKNVILTPRGTFIATKIDAILGEVSEKYTNPRK